MANVIKHKRGSGSDPSASNLVIGELAIRTDNGKLFTKMDSGSIAEIAGGGSDIAINTLSSSSATGGGSATFNGSAYRFTLSSPPSVSAAQLLVSVNGVIQKPVPGTGQPSEGFSVSGNDIIFGDAPATGADFFILTFRSLGVSEPAANSVTNAKVASNAAIAGTKISPDFGSQNITTTGNLVNTTSIQALGHTAITGTPHTYYYGRGDQAGGVSVYSRESALELVSSEDSTHGGSVLIRTVTDGAGFVYNSTTNALELKLFTPSSNNFTIHGTGSNLSSLDTQLRVVKDAQVELAHNGTVKLTTSSSGIDVTGSVAVSGSTDGVLNLNTSDSRGAFVRFGQGGSFHNMVGCADGLITGFDKEDLGIRATDKIGFATNGDNIKMTILSNGNVGIGTTSPNRIIHAASTGHPYIKCESTNTTGAGIEVKDTSENWLIQADGGVGPGLAFYDLGRTSYRLIIDSSGNLSIRTNDVALSGSGTLRINSGSTAGALNLDGGSSNHGGEINLLGGSNGGRILFRSGQGSGQQTEKMRLNENGVLLVESQSHYSDGTIGRGCLQLDGRQGARIGMTIRAKNSDGSAFVTANVGMIGFVNGNGTVGHIATNGSATQYYTSSDYRLKENETPISDGITRLKTLKPYRFNFKADPKVTVDGFFAHEVTAVPEATSGTKDEVDENNEPIYQSIDQAKLVPLLVAALQEAIGRIEALEAK